MQKPALEATGILIGEKVGDLPVIDCFSIRHSQIILLSQMEQMEFERRHISHFNLNSKYRFHQLALLMR
jgi:hypothetical protein